MKRRIFWAGVFLALLGSQALPSDRTSVARAAGSWVAQVRLEVQGLTAPDGDPHVAFLISESMGKAGVPASQSGGSHASVRITMTPAEARELADALNAWADTPSDATIYTRQR